MLALALDLGGTSIKGGLVDLTAGTLRRVVTAPFPAFVPASAPGVREIDPAALRAAALDVLARLLVDAPAEVTSLALCGQMHGLVLADRTGAPLGPATTWQDTRALTAGADSVAPWEALRATLTDADWEACGRDLAPGYPLAVLHARVRAGEALPAGAVPLGLADWLALSLGGGPPAMDPGSAAATGAWDVLRGGWRHDLLARLGLGGLAWPTVVAPGARIGTWKPDGRAIAVLAPLGDQQAALLGAALAPGELSLNIGTGSQVSRRLAEPIAGEFQLRPFPAGGLLATITHLPAGRALNVLFRLVTELVPAPRDEGALWAAIDARALAAAPADLRADLAFFPCRLGEAGAFTGVREEAFGVGDVFRAAYAAMAENYAVAAGRLVPARDWSGIVLSGGLGHRAEALGQALAERLPGAWRRSPCAEETLVGLLVLARAAAGLDSDVEAARAWLAALPPDHAFTP